MQGYEPFWRKLKNRGTLPIMSTSTIDESTILARVIGSNEPGLPPNVALEFLKWGFDESDKQRMSELAAKASQGSLTSEEQAETESFERVSSFLGLVKSKARRSLQAHSGQ
jgi:hypothetical protein